MSGLEGTGEATAVVSASANFTKTGRILTLRHRLLLELHLHMLLHLLLHLLLLLRLRLRLLLGRLWGLLGRCLLRALLRLLLLGLGRGLTGGRASVRQTKQVGDRRERALVVVDRRGWRRLGCLYIAVRCYLLSGVGVLHKRGRHLERVEKITEARVFVDVVVLEVLCVGIQADCGKGQLSVDSILGVRPEGRKRKRWC